MIRDSIPLRYVSQLYPPVSFDGFQDDDDLTFLPMDRVKNGYFLPNSDKYSKYVSSYNAFEEGDILLAKVTPCFENGNIAIAENLVNEKGFGSSELFIVRPTTIDRKFLSYYFQSSTFKQEGEASMTGAGGLKRVSPDLLRQHHVPLPSKTVQQAIANYLDRETAHIDALIAEKERMLALLEEKRAALISQAVTRGLDPDVPLKPSGLDWLGDIPAHWEVCQQKRAWQSNDYGISDSIREDGDIKVLRMSCIVNGRIDLNKAGTIEAVDSYLLLKKRDLLFNRTNSIDQVAKVGILDIEPADKVSFASYLVRIRTNHRALPEYLVYLLNSNEFITFARKNAIPAIGQANLSPSKYGELKIPLPPIIEQETIAKELSLLEENNKNLVDELQASIELLKERRSALISAAVTGQIDPKEMTA